MAFGVGDQKGEVGQSVEPSREAVGLTMQLEQGRGVEQGRLRPGIGESAQDISGRLVEGQRTEEDSGRSGGR